ncbi:hypothetical protein [Flindersiella endophytica]
MSSTQSFESAGPSFSPWFAGLVDDAALFPPGNAPMAGAVPAHGRHRSAAHAGLVGPFLCPDQRLPELGTALSSRPAPDEPFAIGLIVTGGAGAIAPALTWASRDSRLRLAAVEVALRDEPDPGRNARRVAYAFDAVDRPDGMVVCIEIPRAERWETALDVVAENGHRAKLRTGGADASAYPSEQEVARFILACLDREVPFKCTAGLHNAVRHTGDDGCEHHGFLNILLATRAALDGAGEDDLVALLADRDGEAVARKLTDDEARAEATRRWFTSFGSCSVDEPLADLTALGLLSPRH